MEKQAPTSWSDDWGKIIYSRIPPGPNTLRRATSPTYTPRLDGSPSPVSEKGEGNQNTKQTEDPEKIRKVSRKRIYETPSRKYHAYRKFYKTDIPTRKPACTNIDVITSIMTQLHILKTNLADQENELKNLNYVNMKLRRRVYQLEKEKLDKRSGRRF